MNVKAVVKLSTEKLIITMHADGRTIFRNETTLVPQAVLRIPEHTGPFKLCISPNGKKLAISRWDLDQEPWRQVVQVYELVPARH